MNQAMAHTTSSPQIKDRVVQSAFKVMFGNVACLIAGMASQLVVAWAFGSGVETDAFLTATVIPNYLEWVVLGGLSFVFIPVFVREKTAGRDDDAWALAGTLFLLVGGLLGAIAVAGALTASQMIAITAPGLSANKAELAASMLRVVVMVLPLHGVVDMAVGVQNARGRYFWPAAAPALGSLGNLTVVLLGRGELGSMVLAWGWAVSAILRALVVLKPCLGPALTRLLPLNDPRIREVARLVLPLTIFAIFTHLMPLSQRFLASGLSDGDLSYLGYASKISTIVLSMLGAGIASGLFQEMTKEYETHGTDGLVRAIDYGFRLTLALILPVATLLSVLAIPVVEVLFERGDFSHTATIAVAHVLPLYLLLVVFQVFGNVVIRGFYVVRDTLTSPTVGAVSTLLSILMAMMLSGAIGYTGLAIAEATEAGLAAAGCYMLMPRHMRVLPFRSAIHYLLASLAAGIAAWAVTQPLVGSHPSWIVLAGLCAGLISYTSLLWLVGEASMIVTLMGAAKSVLPARIGPSRKEER